MFFKCSLGFFLRGGGLDIKYKWQLMCFRKLNSLSATSTQIRVQTVAASLEASLTTAETQKDNHWADS